MFAALFDDMMGQSIDVIDTALAAAKAKRDEAELEIAAITAMVDSRQLFQDHGHRSVTGYLKQQLNCSASDAGRLKQRGRLFNQYPKIGDALGASWIGVRHVDLLVDAEKHPVAGERFAEFVPLLTEQAEQLEYADFAVAVKHFTTQADPDGSFDDQQFHDDHRTASVAVNNGAVNVHASGGDPLRAEEMKAVFGRAVEAEFDRDCAERRRLHGDDALNHPLERSGDQRKFDAMYQIFIDSITAPADGLRPEPLVNIVIDPQTGIDTLVRHGLLDDTTVDTADRDTGLESFDPTSRRCATSTGTQLHPDAAVRAMLRGQVRRVVVDAHDVIIDMGRKQRLFTGKAREAAQLLAIRCGHRGCDIPAEFCDIDHIDEHVDGGQTNQNNALPMCGSHNRSKHQRQLRGRRDERGRVHLIRPDGTVIKPLNTRDPRWADDDELDQQTTGAEVPFVPGPDGPFGPARATTWAELTEHSTAPSRQMIPPGATVQIINLPAA